MSEHHGHKFFEIIKPGSNYEFIGRSHLWIGISMAVLLVGHIGAALYHHFVRRDEILLRMLAR